MAGFMSRFKKSVKGLLGITYDVDQTEITPILPDKGSIPGQSLGKLLNELKSKIESKKQLYQKYSKIRENHLVESLLDKVKMDILHKGRPQDKPLIEITYPDEEILGICQNAVKMFKFEVHIEETLDDLLLYGEYYLRNDFANSQLDDCYEFVEMMPLYSRGEVAGILKIKNNEFGGKVDKQLDPLMVSVFSLPTRRMKLRVRDKSNNKLYVKIPSPFVIPSVLELLNILSLLEKLIPLAQLIKVNGSQVIGVNVPPGTPMKQVFEICKEYEKQLNEMVPQVSIDSVDEILGNYGKFKCIPSVNQKASMSITDVPRPSEMQLTDFEYILNTLSNRLGVPINYIISGAGEQDPKAMLIYLNKLKAIRNAIASTVKVFLINYFEYRKRENPSIELDPEQLIVKLPTVPGTESLDSVDYADAMTGTLSNVQRIIADFTTMLKDVGPEVRKANLLRVLNARLYPIIGDEVFDVQAAETPANPENPDEEPPQEEPELMIG